MPGRTLDDDDIDFIRHLRRTALDHAQTLNDTPALSGSNPIAGSFIVGDPAGAHVVVGTDANGADGVRLYSSDGTTVLIDLNISSLPAHIVGARIETATTGARWLLSGSGSGDAIYAFSGNAAEVSPGSVLLDVLLGGGYRALMSLISADLGSGNTQVTCYSPSSDGTIPGKVLVSANQLDLSGCAVTPHLYLGAFAGDTDLLSFLAAYTPTATNFTVGNGTWNAFYKIVGKMLYLRVFFTAGTTTTYTGSQFAVSLPAGLTAAASGGNELPAIYAPGGTQFAGLARVNAGSTVVQLKGPTSSTTTTLVNVDSTHPAAWTSTTSNFFSFSGWIELQ